MKRNIGKQIKAARTASGLSQAALAEACGWIGDNLQARVSHYENGRRKPTIDDLDLIAAALSVNLFDLLAGNIAKTEKSPSHVPLIAWKDISDTENAEPLDFIACPPEHSQSTFALKVEGDTMTSQAHGSISFPAGCYIFVDNKPDAKSGDAVIAISTQSNEATFKVLVKDFGKTWLKPLNISHPTIEAQEGEIHIAGVVIGSFTPIDRFHTLS